MNKKKADDKHEKSERDFERLEKLLSRGLAEISGIEFEEIVKGISGDELEQKVGKDIHSGIIRSEYSEAKKAGDLVFEEGISFLIEEDGKDVNDIDLEDLQRLSNVSPETLVAVCSIDEKRPDLFERRLQDCDATYQDHAGIKVKTDGGRLLFYAARRGKVVVIKNEIHIVSSDRDGCCIVKVSPDLMEARIDCKTAFGDGVKLTFSMVFEELGRCRVSRGIDSKAIETAVEAANRNCRAQTDVIVARGQPAQHGKDSVVTLHFPDEILNPGFRILPDGRIDYRKQAPIKMAATGDVIATVTEPEPGCDGFLIDGTVLPALQGSADVIIEGENVRKDEKCNKYYAECSGVVSFHEKILSVYPHYQVDGDVDMHSGNVTFNGSVTVCGNVKSGFEVKATGDISVLGSVEAANIDAGRDVRINGAAVGGNGTIIKSGRNIFIGHVQNAQIEAQGDVEIVRSAMHSSIFSTGTVRLHDGDGSIVGGLVNAMRGIEAISIGSPMGTQTEVVAGSDYLVKRKKNEIHEIIRFYEGNLTKIDMVLRPLTDILKKGIPLGGEKKQRLGLIVDKRKDIVKQLRMLRQRYKSLSEAAPAAGRAFIVARKTLFQDVTVKIGDHFLRTDEDLQGVEYRLSSDLAQIERRSPGGSGKQAAASSRKGRK